MPAKGVVGSSLNKAEKIMKSMGVPVAIYKVYSEHPGKIVASDPMPGEPLGESRSIKLAIGDDYNYSDNLGVPVELFNTDKDSAYRKMMNRGGYNKIRLVPRYSSRKYIGKIVGSNPALGTHNASESLTLYYGADASETKKMFTSKREYGEGNHATVVSTLVPFVGKWCTKSGDCLEFETGHYNVQDPEENTDILLRGSHAMEDLAGDDSRKYHHSFDMWQYTQQLLGDAIDTDDSSENKNSLPLRNTLLFGDSGMVDIFRDGGAPYCGNKIVEVHSDYCINGKIYSYQDLDNDSRFEDYKSDYRKIPGMNQGLVFKMRAYFVLVPVNAKLDEVEASGFFKGIGSTKPDMNRPFILRRDPASYSESERVANAKDSDLRRNPFIPTEFNKPIPFAPAPDDSNVYYLVEQPFDWNSFVEDREL